MKSRLAPIPRKIVQAHLMKMVDDSNGKIKSIALKRSLGAASVGEAFLCEFTYVEAGVEKKEKMVVKIMRHDAEDRVKREAEVFTAAAAKIGPGMLKTWQGQLAQYMTEFDFHHEADNVYVGAGLYNVKGTANHPYKAIAPDVASMKVSPLVQPSKNAMVCTLAPGVTADAAFKEMREQIQTSLNPVFERDAETGRLKWDPQTRKPIFKQNVGAGMIHDARIFCAHEYSRIYATQQKLQQAASLWFSEALLGSGKFHGDAHAGNLMVTLGPEGQATFIDFGNLYELKTHYELDGEGNKVMETVQEVNEAGELVEVQRPKVLLDERVELLRLILGATLRDKTFFMQGFEKLLSEDGKKAFAANRENVAAILDSVLAKGAFSFDVCYRLQGALTELQKLGLELPPQINCFVQSMTRFQNTIAEMNTILRQTGTVIDMLKEGPAPDKIPPADPADPLGEVLALSTTPEGKAMVELENELYDPGAAPDEDGRVRLPRRTFDGQERRVPVWPQRRHLQSRRRAGRGLAHRRARGPPLRPGEPGRAHRPDEGHGHDIRHQLERRPGRQGQGGADRQLRHVDGPHHAPADQRICEQREGPLHRHLRAADNLREGRDGHALQRRGGGAEDVRQELLDDRQGEDDPRRDRRRHGRAQRQQGGSCEDVAAQLDVQRPQRRRDRAECHRRGHQEHGRQEKIISDRYRNLSG